MESTIKLFKALPIKTKERKTDSKLLETTIKYGFVFAPEVVANYSNYDELIRLVKKTVGLTAEQINSSFHKSWIKIKEVDIEQLVVEQIAHYLTTYGKEQPELYLAQKELQWGVDGLADKVADLGDMEMDRVQDADYIYIPSEALDIPDIKLGAIRLVVIKGYTKEELRDKLIKLLESGIALGEDTIQAVVEVAMFVELDNFERVNNKEVKAVLYDLSGLFPENPVEFLRIVTFKATSKTLLIKSPDVIQAIKESNNLNVVKIFNDYEKKYGLERLAEIFYRFKPIFLAFRTNERMKVVVNKIRRLAVRNHKPLPEDFLNTITAKMRSGEEITPNKLQSELNRVNVFRKIRLAYALKFRTKDVASILYKIRNGKGYATGFTFSNKEEAKEVLGVVLDSIAQSVSNNVKGKKIYIPEFISYSLPATEKQFTGNFPSGTCVVIPNDMIAGIYWDNVKHNSIDLDLSITSPDTGKIGWDGNYRTEERTILFSGDMTDASNGASELFYMKRQIKNSFIVFVNYYNFDSEIEVPFKILVAKEVARDFGQNYMVNPNNIVAITESRISQKQKILGLIIVTSSGSKFYFAETNIGRSITSRNSEFAKHSRRYLLDFYENTICLKEMLIKAGAEIVGEQDEADVDLSPEKIEKDTIINLLV